MTVQQKNSTLGLFLKQGIAEVPSFTVIYLKKKQKVGILVVWSYDGATVRDKMS